MTNSSLVSLRSYASSRGMALSTLQHHIKTGKVKTIEGKIDPAYADVCLREQIDRAQSARGAGQKRKHESAAVPDSIGGQSFEIPDGFDIEQARKMVPRNFAESQFLSSLEDLQRRRMENEAKEGGLVDAEEVSRVQFETARQLRDAIMAIPSRLADMLAVATDPNECARMLTTELRQALESVAMAADAAGGEQFDLELAAVDEDAD